MEKYFFTSDWHNGEIQAPNTHSYLRPRPTEIMVEEWLKDLESKITKEDTLVFVGDLGINLSDYKFYTRLPECKKILILGDKEYSNKNFTQPELFLVLDDLKIFDTIVMNTTITINSIDYFVSHKPSDCFNQPNPAICGHIHGIWRLAKMLNGQPIINVGIDVWGGLVSEEFIIHQHRAAGLYDDEAFPANWDKKETFIYPERFDEMKKLLGDKLIVEKNNVGMSGNFIFADQGMRLLNTGDLLTIYKSGRIDYIEKWRR